LILENTETSWMETCLFITFLMIIMGFLTVLEWDILFPDTRDYTNLLTLPIRIRTLFLAKMASLLVFAGLFAVFMNFFSPFIFCFYLLKDGTGLTATLRFLLAHGIAGLTACAFIFLFTSVLVGFLAALLGQRLFKRIAIYLRGFLMTVFFIQLIFFISASIPLLRSVFDQSPQGTPQSLFCRLFPPMWFTGLFEVLNGNPQPLFLSGARVAAIALLLVPCLFLLLSTLGYRKYLKALPETSGRTRLFLRPERKAAQIFSSLTFRNSTERAVFVFFKNSLKSSPLHKMRLITLFASSLGLVFLIFAYLVSKQLDLRQIHKGLLAVPLIVSLIFLLGIKNVISIPLDLPANWIFRLTEYPQIRFYLTGLKKGIVFLIIAPILGLCFIFLLLLWGWKPALLHTFFSLGVATILLETLLWNFSKIPFACSYLPGKAKLHIFASLYFLAFLLYTTLTSTLASLILDSPIYFLGYAGMVFVALYIIRAARTRHIRKYPDLQFEEEPESLISLFPIVE